MPMVKEGSIYQAITPLLEDKAPDQSAFHLLDDGLSAFVARAVLIDQAQHSLDLQYYIFRQDVSGKILIAKLIQAAERGVRVRILLDDIGSALDNRWLATFNHHPNIELRVFNPVRGRSGLSRALQQAGTFSQTNRRMHNKLLVADSMIAITGGRNIGDQYFSNTHVDFQDLDVLAIGEIVKPSHQYFDDYWNHVLSVPIDLLIELDSEKSFSQLSSLTNQYLQDAKNSEFINALKQSNFLTQLRQGRLDLSWGNAYVYADPPDKALTEVEIGFEEMLGSKIGQVLANGQQRLLITSAYFVPTSAGMEFLQKQLKQGVEISILTNALSTTDVSAVHSKYRYYREPLIKAGAKLWELRSSAKQTKRQKWFRSRSQASLHAKTFVIDQDKSIVGSANFDPRSIKINTEMAILIVSASLNQKLARIFENLTTPESAWKLELDEDEDLSWHAIDKEQQPLVYDKEPETSWWMRFKVWLVSILPIEDQI